MIDIFEQIIILLKRIANWLVKKRNRSFYS
jgi:hypothetical protein